MRMNQVVASIVALAFSASIAFAGGGTAFTYQGRLFDVGEPANGLFDFEFELWDAANGGNPIGVPQVLLSTPVTDGLFTVQIDFDANAFDNTDRWLEISVNAIELTPRQPITRSPYSIQTRGMVIGDDGNVLFNSMSAIEGTVTFSSIGGIDMILDADTNNVGENQNARIVMRQDGGLVVGRMGYREAANTLEIMQEYSSNLILGTNNEDRLTIRANGFVGIGRSNPITGSEYFGFNAPVNSGYGGMYISTNGEGAWPFYGYAAGGTSDMWHYYDGSTGKWHLYNGVSNRLTVQSNGNVGIGTTAPDYTLHVVSNAGFRAIFGLTTGPSGFRVGVYGETASTNGSAVYGIATANTGFNAGVQGGTNSASGFGVYSAGDFGGSGAKYFIQPHPYDPSREIRFVCLEGNESGTYFRGSTSLVNGRAYINVPEEFRLVSELDGLTVQVTAMGPNAGLWVESKDLDRIVVVGNGNVEFDYFVNGVRRGFADLELIRENYAYVPEVRGVPYGTQYREGHRQILVENGILNPDFTPNEATATMMGWTLRDPEPDELSRAASSTKGESR